MSYAFKSSHARRRIMRLALVPLLAASAVMATATPAQAGDCKTSSGRPCTGSEQAYHCSLNAVDAYHECKDGARGFFEKAFCFGKYELDFYYCWTGAVISR